jgi:transformation/transcription domain-associated protein
MKETFRTPGFQTGESPQIRIFQTFICLHENRIVEVDQLCKKAMSFLVHQWVGWPSIPSMAHMQMLQSFQKIIELYESAKIMKDIRDPNVSNTHKVTEVKHILKTWQQRLPNAWDDIYHWNDLLRWRQHVYSLITETFKNEPNVDKSIGHRDTAWSIHKFAEIARYQGLPELCLSALKEVEEIPHLTPPLAFKILREQLLCYLDMPSFYKVGLKIIDKTNLDSFEPTEKVHRLSNWHLTPPRPNFIN